MADLIEPVQERGSLSQPLLTATGIKKSFSMEGRRIDVLRGADISVVRGEMVAIVGASGVGKSTLMQVLGALDAPDFGNVKLKGVDVFALNEQARAEIRNRLLGYVFQFHHLLAEFTAAENVAMPMFIAGYEQNIAIEKANLILADLGLSNRVAHRPAQLSGGEQQRVAVARSLVMDPDLVLADEPTGNLDRRNSESLLQIFRDLHERRGLTSVLVTHSSAVASVCDRVLYMTDGVLEKKTN